MPQESSSKRRQIVINDALYGRRILSVRGTQSHLWDQADQAWLHIGHRSLLPEWRGFIAHLARLMLMSDIHPERLALQWNLKRLQKEHAIQNAPRLRLIGNAWVELLAVPELLMLACAGPRVFGATMTRCKVTTCTDPWLLFGHLEGTEEHIVETAFQMIGELDWGEGVETLTYESAKRQREALQHHAVQLAAALQPPSQ